MSYGRKKEGHCFRNCPNYDKHRRCIQFYWEITDVATYLFSDEYCELDDARQKLLAYFLDADKKVDQTENDNNSEYQDLYDWITVMFHVVDSSLLND